MGGGVVIAVLLLATPDVEQLRKTGERRSLERTIRQGAPGARTGARADAARRARTARRRAGGVGRRTVRVRRRRARARASLRAPHPRSRRFTTCAARRSMSSGVTRRRGASTTWPSSRSERRRSRRMEKLWLARIYARRGYVVLADRLYESMQPAPPASDAEVSLNQADAHLINEDWMGGAASCAATSRSSRRACAAARCSAGRSRRAATSDGELRGAAQPVRRRSVDRPRSRLRARARTRRELRRGARSLLARAVAGRHQPGRRRW